MARKKRGIIMKMEEYENIVEQLQNCMDIYEKKYEGSNYTFYLANGDCIKMTVPESRIPHLLGINVDTIRNNYLVRRNAKDAYTVLNQFIETNSYYDLKRKNICFSSIFSDYIKEKINSFKLVFEKSAPDDIYCIIKYNSERTYQMEQISDICEYFIIKKENGHFYVTGLVKENDNRENYVPATVRYYDNEQELETFLSRIAKNQEITYAYKVITNNWNNGFHKEPSLFTTAKANFVKNMMNIAEKYEGIPSICKDYLFILNNSLSNFQGNTNILTLIKELTESIKNGKILVKDRMDSILGEARNYDEIKALVDTCNDLVCRNEGEGNITFSQIQDENTKMKEELKRARSTKTRKRKFRSIPRKNKSENKYFNESIQRGSNYKLEKTF